MLFKIAGNFRYRVLFVSSIDQQRFYLFTEYVFMQLIAIIDLYVG